ncbi:MAG: hypothetical protein IT260_23635, partial [Saprospiraceae bacterium]|nr:hypothetical protein [Saprospiraceae bacterium]
MRTYLAFFWKKLPLAAFLGLSLAAFSQTQSITWSAVGDYGSSTQNFCRAAEGYFECQALSNYKFGITTKQRGTLSASHLNFGVHINNTAAPYKIDFLQNGVVTGSYFVNPAATDKIKMERQGSLLYVYHYVAATGITTTIQIFETDANLTYRAMAIKTPAGTFTALAAVASTSLTQGCNPGTTAINETNRNWEHLKLYDADQDGTGLIGETRGYSDKFGHLTQQQQRHFPTETVLASERIFDAHGRQVLSTLPAPTANTSIQYVPNFIQNSSGGYSNFSKFDTPGTLNNPAPVGAAAGTLGYYYSNNNSAEPYAPSSQYPYSRVEYGTDGSIKRQSGVGEAYKMGSGHETRMFYVNAGAELGFLYGGRKSYEVDWAAATPLSPAPRDIGQNIVALKSVTVNPDGTETIAYKSLSGLLLATCASGKAENCTNGQVARHKLYDNKAASSLNEYGTASVKIHLPAAKRTSLQLYPNKGYGINAYYLAGGNVSNLFSFSLYDLNNNAMLTAGTDYTITFDPANWRFQVSFTGPYNSSTQSRFLHIRFAYTNTYYSAAYTNYIPGYEPPLVVKYELDYSNWSLNYYDDKGLLRMSVPPKGINCGLGDPSKYTIKSYSKYSDFYTLNAGVYNYTSTPFLVETVPMDQSEVSGSNMGTELGVRLRSMIKPGIQSDGYAKDYSPTFANASDFIDIAVPPSPKKPTGGGGYLYLPAAGFDALYSPLQAPLVETNAPNTTLHFRETAEGPASTTALCRNGVLDVGEIRMDQGGVCGNTGNTPCSDTARFLIAFRFRVSLQNPGGTELAWGYIYRTLGSDCHNLFLEMPNSDGPPELAFVLNNAQINSAANIQTKITEIKVKETEFGTYSANFSPATAHHRLIRYIYLLFDATRERYLVNPVPHTMAQTYHYDALDRLIATQDPDRGKTEYIYDDEGKLRFVQDAAQWALAASPNNISAFSYLDYDREGRVVETGEYYRSTTGGAGSYHYFPNAYYLPTATCPPGDAYHIYCNANLRNAAGALSFASGNTRNKSSLTYDFLNPALALPAGVGAAYRPMFAEGRLALSANENHKTWYRYNHRGELTASVQQHLGLGAYDIGAVTHDYEYDYFGRLKRSLLQKGNASGQFEQVYLYNDAGELVCVESKKGTGGARIKHARNSYYKTGPLKRSELGNRLQGLDYVYTIDGALKSLNHPQLSSADPGKDGYAGPNSAVKADVFGFALDYFPADYVRSNTFITYGSSAGASNERYDGRIKGLRWNTRFPALGASAGAEHMFRYDYDWQQQLKTTEFGVYSPNSATNNAAGSGGYASPVYGSFTADAQSRYKEDNLSYDLNGNLGTLRRYGLPQGSTPTQMDNLTAYTLQSGTNRLSSVTEASAFTDPAINDVRPQGANNYTYYDNGALKTDLSNDLSLEYNAAGLTTAVRNATGTQLKLSFVYDEQGHRVRKVEYTAGVASKTTL